MRMPSVIYYVKLLEKKLQTIVENNNMKGM